MNSKFEWKDAHIWYVLLESFGFMERVAGCAGPLALIDE